MLLPTRGDDTRGRAARRVEDDADRARAAGRGKVRGVMAALMVEVVAWWRL